MFLPGIHGWFSTNSPQMLARDAISDQLRTISRWSLSRSRWYWRIYGSRWRYWANPSYKTDTFIPRGYQNESFTIYSNIWKFWFNKFLKYLTESWNIVVQWKSRSTYGCYKKQKSDRNSGIKNSAKNDLEMFLPVVVLTWVENTIKNWTILAKPYKLIIV